MVSYLTRMPAGIAGVLTRTEHATVEPGLYSAASTFTAFGLPAKLSGGYYVPFTGGEAATALAAINVKPFPFQSTATSSDALGAAAPTQAGGSGSFLKRGYMTIQMNGGATVAKGGQVYIRVANAVAGKPIGGFEGAASGNASATSAVKSGGNTGTGTNVPDATTPVLANAKAGVYTLRCIAAATNGGTFRLTDPTGVVLGDYALPGTAGSSVTISNQIKTVITDATTDFAVGDGFDVTVVLAGSDTIAPAGLTFMGPADSNGFVEIAYNI